MFVGDARGVVVNERYTGKEGTLLLLLEEDVAVAAIGEEGCCCHLPIGGTPPLCKNEVGKRVSASGFFLPCGF